MPNRISTLPAVSPPGAVGFLWPAALWGLLIIPLLAAAYLWALRRRARTRVRFSEIETLAAAMNARRRRWRHVPEIVFLLAFAATGVALARPTAPFSVPADIAGIMLAVDVSGSMLSQDVTPSRLEAAKSAAKAFVAGLPEESQVGLVTFAGDAVLHTPPTADHRRVLDAIDAISVRHWTAIGDGLVEALAALPGRIRPLPDGTVPPLPPGPRIPAAVVLLSDGQNNRGLDPLEAAEIARREDVIVYTIGIGRRPGESAQGWVIGGPVDEETLAEIARHTGGQYFHPSTAEEFRAIYRHLARRVGWKTTPVEVTALAATLGAGALIAALVISLLTQPLI
jgi:Ca-activated chloride channel homolog